MEAQWDHALRGRVSTLSGLSTNTLTLTQTQSVTVAPTCQFQTSLFLFCCNSSGGTTSPALTRSAQLLKTGKKLIRAQRDITSRKCGPYLKHNVAGPN